MGNITVYLPKDLEYTYRDDPKKGGLIVALLAEHYGFTINKSRVVKNPTS